MSEFVGYRCWSPAIVARTVATEAVSPSDAVFLATHTPLQIRRLGRGATGQRQDSITESDLLDEFLGVRPKEGVVVAPVLGESGSGKSHLVRWAKANIPTDSRRHVIYLPKTQTSLRDVVNALLLDQSGGVFDEIRAQMARLGESVSQDSLERRILDELAEALTTAYATDPFTKPLVGSKGLAVLMHDPMFRDHMLRPGAFINRRAEHAIHGRSESGGDVPLEFGIGDLPLDIANAANLDNAARAAQSLFRKLITNARIQQAAVDLLNANLDIAVSRAAHLGVGDVNRAFLTLREQLVGHEIILLIEDFALIQGVRRDLLDAIVEAGVVGGREKYATVRTLMAVTTGYYRQLDETFRTRAEASSPRYEIDVRLAEAGSATDRATIDFVAKYLNVARLGEDKVAAQGAGANACHSCPFQDECHAGFGTSSDGFGLYPYNPPAIRRAIQAAAPDEHPDSFIARSVLSRAVRDVLIGQADDIADGTFPGPAFASELPPKPSMPRLGLPARQALESSYPEAEAERRTVLLEYWGGCQGLVNLDPAVHRAFRVSPLPEDIATQAQPPAPASELPGQPAPASLPRSLVVSLEDIEKWANGAELKQSVAREIRNIVIDAVVSRATWMNPPMRAEGGPVSRVFSGARTQASLYVSIEGARESRAASVHPPIRFSRSASNAQFFIDLLRARAGHMEGARASLARLERIATRASGDFEGLVVAKEGIGDEQLIAAMRSMLIGAALCGRLPEKPSREEYLDAIFWNGVGEERGDVSWRAPRWVELEERYRRLRLEPSGHLRDALGIAQGSAGAIHAIDVNRALALVKLALSDSQDLATPTWAEKESTARRQLEEMCPAQISQWGSHIEAVRRQVPSAVGFKDTVGALAAAAREGGHHGFVPADLQEVGQRNASAEQLDFGSFLSVERLVARAEGAEGRLAIAAIAGKDIGEVPARISDYLDWSSQWVDAGLRFAASQGTVHLDDLDQRIDDVVRDWLGMEGGQDNDNG